MTVDTNEILAALPKSSDLFDVTDISVFSCEGAGEAGYLIVLDGSVVMPHIERLILENPDIAAHMPVCIGVDVADRLSDFSPWPHEAFHKEDNDFRGLSQQFYQESILLLKRVLDAVVGGPSAILGFSLGGLVALQSVCESESFSRVFALSPSVWYPDFASWMAVQQIRNTQHVYLIYGKDEGRNRMAPLKFVGEYAHSIFCILDENPHVSVQVMTDRKGHFKGLSTRVEKALRSYSQREF